MQRGAEKRRNETQIDLGLGMTGLGGAGIGGSGDFIQCVVPRCGPFVRRSAGEGFGIAWGVCRRGLLRGDPSWNSDLHQTFRIPRSALLRLVEVEGAEECVDVDVVVGFGGLFGVEPEWVFDVGALAVGAEVEFDVGVDGFFEFVYGPVFHLFDEGEYFGSVVSDEVGESDFEFVVSGADGDVDGVSEVFLCDDASASVAVVGDHGGLRVLGLH